MPTHYGGRGSGRSASSDFPFLAYLGYKTFGWFVVLVAVLLLLRYFFCQAHRKLSRKVAVVCSEMRQEPG